MPRGTYPKTISYSDTSSGVEVPDERFSSASEVRGLCQTMIDADYSRGLMRSRVDNLVDGFPTYPKSLTASKGMGWFPRVNYLEADGLIRTMQTPLYDLVTEVDHCINLTLDIPKDKASNWQVQDWENKIEQHFTWLLFKPWRKSFNFHIPLSQREMLVHGIGAHVWPNDRWIPRTPRSGQILFPESASVDFQEDGEYFMLRDFVNGVNVYNFIRNEKSAKKKGWEPDNVLQGLANADKKNQKVRSTYNVEEYRRRWKNGDIGYWASSEVGLWLNWLFVKEYDEVDGKQYSLYCVDENFDVNTKKGNQGYYFKKRFTFDEWPLVIYNYDLGLGDIHSVRGLGWRMKDYFEVSNRVKNMMVAQVIVNSGPRILQTQPNIDPDKLKLMRHGWYSIYPYGVQEAVQQFPQLSNTGIALEQHLQQAMERNNQSSSSSVPEPRDRETKYSFMLRSNQRAQVSNGLQSFYESSLQQTFEMLFRRIINTPKGEAQYEKWRRCSRNVASRTVFPKKSLKRNTLAK